MRAIATSGRTRTRVCARLIAGLLALVAFGRPEAVAGQTAAFVPGEIREPAKRLPFAVGERLTYRVRVAKLGTLGRGTMWVEGPQSVRGTETYVLRFSFKTRIGPVTAVDRTESWLDPTHMAALRFHKHERHPLSKHDEKVEIFPAERRWESADGAVRESTTGAPLDELSFMYFIRTLPLVPDTVYRFNRHFDPARNPTTVRVIGRDTVATGAGHFPAVLVEMRVRDPRRYRGDGIIRIYLSDDDRRIPVRIESAMPVVGSGALILESYSEAGPQLAAHPE